MNIIQYLKNDVKFEPKRILCKQWINDIFKIGIKIIESDERNFIEENIKNIATKELHKIKYKYYKKEFLQLSSQIATFYYFYSIGFLNKIEIFNDKTGTIKLKFSFNITPIYSNNLKRLIDNLSFSNHINFELFRNKKEFENLLIIIKDNDEVVKLLINMFDNCGDIYNDLKEKAVLLYKELIKQNNRIIKLSKDKTEKTELRNTNKRLKQNICELECKTEKLEIDLEHSTGDEAKVNMIFEKIKTSGTARGYYQELFSFIPYLINTYLNEYSYTKKSKRHNVSSVSKLICDLVKNNTGFKINYRTVRIELTKKGFTSEYIKKLTK